MSDPLKVFLCHASEDSLAVRDLHQKLVVLGINVWFDKEKLLPGMEWEIEIPKAVKNTDVVIVCLSKSSITKEGYIQKEIKLALDTADEKPEGTLFIIPIRLEECNVPTRLSKWQWMDLFLKDSFQKLILSLKTKVETLERTSLKEIHPGSIPGQQTWGNIEFVPVKAGSFLMGSKNNHPFANDCEKPQHTISIPYDFFISRHPITNAQYHQFAIENQINRNVQNNWKTMLEYPVTQVSWHDAMKFCEWLNYRYVKELPENMCFCLPTELEWEKAARGTFGNEWPWGNKWEVGFCNSNESGNTTTPVKYYSPNGDSPYGATDMAGNIWEWTLSLWGISQDKNDFAYPYDPADGREDTKAGFNFLRVLRGGSFQDTSQNVRCASRRGGFPLMSWPSSGFRIVCVNASR